MSTVSGRTAADRGQQRCALLFCSRELQPSMTSGPFFLLLFGATGCLPSLGANRQGPPPSKKPPGGWRCCWGIESCAGASTARCPDDPHPLPAGCATDYAACVGPCSSPENQTRWCQTDPTGCGMPGDDPKKCGPPASSFDDPTLRQTFRPPQQTPLQAEAMAEIAATAL